MMRSGKVRRDKLPETAKQMNELVASLNQSQFDYHTLADQNFNNQNVVHQQKYMRYKSMLKEKFFDSQMFSVQPIHSAFKEEELKTQNGFLSAKTPIKQRKISTSPMPNTQLSLSSNGARAKSQKNQRYERYEPRTSISQSQSNRVSNRGSWANASQPSKLAAYSLELDQVIQKSHTARKKPRIRHLLTLTQRKKKEEHVYKQQKEQILQKVLQNDIAELFSAFAKYSAILNPQQKQAKYQEIKRKELSNLEKYSISFANYIRQKTHRNVEQGIYDEKIRKKATLIEKFHAYILEEAKISDEIKSKLARAFKGIEHEFRRAQRSKQMRLK